MTAKKDNYQLIIESLLGQSPNVFDGVAPVVEVTTDNFQDIKRLHNQHLVALVARSIPADHVIYPKIYACSCHDQSRFDERAYAKVTMDDLNRWMHGASWTASHEPKQQEEKPQDDKQAKK